MLLGLQGIHRRSLLGEQEWLSCPTSMPKGRHSFVSSNYGGEPIESESVERVFNKGATISTWFITSVACGTQKVPEALRLAPS